MSDTPGLNQNVGRNPVPTSLVEERRRKAVSLRVAGLSMQSVLGELNKQEATRHWGVISLRTLERDIAAYYRKGRPLDPSDDRDHVERMRDCHVAQLDNLMEEVALLIAEKNKNNDWRPFEKIAALEKLYKMRVQMAELQGWNYGKSKTTVNIANDFRTNKTGLEQAERASQALASLPKEDRERLAEAIRARFDGCETERDFQERRAGFAMLNFQESEPGPEEIFQDAEGGP